MIRILSGAAALLLLGVLTAFAPRAPDAMLKPTCGQCISGIANWHPTFTLTDPNGDVCYVTLTIWRRDGICLENGWTPEGAIACDPIIPCQFIAQAHCTCGTDCQHMYISMYNIDGTLVFSMPMGTYIFGMPCDSMQWVSFVVVNTWTGEATSQLNGFSCDECTPLDDPPDDPPDEGGGG